MKLQSEMSPEDRLRAIHDLASTRIMTVDNATVPLAVWLHDMKEIAKLSGGFLELEK